MRTLGLIGGMSWESTLPYYRLLNQGVASRLGGLHSASLLLWNVNFAEIEALQRQGNWQQAGALLAAVAVKLQQAGAEAIVLCTNTMHIVAEQIADAVQIPLLHIADAVVDELKRLQITHVSLLGTRFTMEQPFYRQRLEQAGMTVLVPDEAGRDTIHRVIYQELCQGLIHAESRQAYQQIIQQQQSLGAQAVILGCTEIGLLLSPADADIPLLDSMVLHVQSALTFMLAC